MSACSVVKTLAVKRKISKESKPTLLVTDFDGCLTDDSVLVNHAGLEFVKVSRKDGLGVSRLKRLGINVLILSTERNKVVSARSLKMGVTCLQNVEDKCRTLKSYAKENQLNWNDIWYIGNDVNDLRLIGEISFSLCPLDAAVEVRRSCDVILPVLGGAGILNYLASLFESCNRSTTGTNLTSL